VSLTVAFAALLTGIVVWGLLARRLTAKPWERSAIAPEDIEVDSTAVLPPAKVGLWAFLAVITSLFGLFISAYWMRMQHAHGVSDWNSITVPRQLWVNTALLVLSSAAMQWARVAANHGRSDHMRAGMLAGGLFAWAFLTGQLLAWHQLSASGYLLGNPAVAFFYLLTGAHGLHLLGGLFVWAKTVIRMARPRVELVDLRLSVELCTVYWHYLLLVWLVLYGVLLST
jgi:cytochrome c oxidase subunit 3